MCETLLCVCERQEVQGNNHFNFFYGFFCMSLTDWISSQEYSHVCFLSEGNLVRERGEDGWLLQTLAFAAEAYYSFLWMLDGLALDT